MLINNDGGAPLVDAIFPEQFDNHICALDTAGIVRFWDIKSGMTTTIVTNVRDVRAFCFGSSQLYAE